MNLRDPEDPPALKPPSVPPMPIEHFSETTATHLDRLAEVSAQEAPTMPPPPVDEALAAAVADLVIKAIKPRLDRLSDELAQVRTEQQNMYAKLQGVDNGVGSALNVVTNCAAQVERVADAVMGLTVVVGGLSEELVAHREHTLDAYDRLGARVVKLEDYKREHEIDHGRQGEDDGSLALAALKGGPPAE